MILFFSASQRWVTKITINSTVYCFYFQVILILTQGILTPNLLQIMSGKFWKIQSFSLYMFTLSLLRKNHSQQNYCWETLADPQPPATWPPKDVNNIVFQIISATTETLRLKQTSKDWPSFPHNILPAWFIEMDFICKCGNMKKLCNTAKFNMLRDKHILSMFWACHKK